MMCDLFTHTYVRTRIHTHVHTYTHTHTPHIVNLKENSGPVAWLNEFKDLYTLYMYGVYLQFGMLNGSPYNATVRCATYCEVLSITRSDLDNLLTSYPLLQK